MILGGRHIISNHQALIGNTIYIHMEEMEPRGRGRGQDVLNTGMTFLSTNKLFLVVGAFLFIAIIVSFSIVNAQQITL